MFRTFGEYELLETRQAQEPYASYYLATSGEGDRLVELRVSNAQLNAVGADVQSVEGRLEDLRRLSHPNLVRVAYAGVRDGVAFYVTDPGESVSLDRYAEDQGGKLSPEYAFDLLLPVGDALAYLHAQGVVHGQVSPLSVRVDPATERCFLGTLDLFHALGLTLPGSGTRGAGASALATPESSKGWAVNPATDVFLFAAVLYRALTGRPAPTMAESAGREAESLLRFRRPSQLVPLPREIDEALLGALSFRPGDRPASLGDLLAVLRTAQPHIAAAQAASQNRSKAIREEALARRAVQDEEKKERRKAARREEDRRAGEIAENPLNALGYWFLDRHPVTKLALFALVAGASSFAPLLDTTETPLMSAEYVSNRMAVKNKQFDRKAIQENLADVAADAAGIETTPETYEQRLRVLRRFAKALNKVEREKLLSAKLQAEMRIAYATDKKKGCALLDRQIKRAYAFLKVQQAQGKTAEK